MIIIMTCELQVGSDARRSVDKVFISFCITLRRFIILFIQGWIFFCLLRLLIHIFTGGAGGDQSQRQVISLLFRPLFRSIFFLSWRLIRRVEKKKAWNCLENSAYSLIFRLAGECLFWRQVLKIAILLFMNNNFWTWRRCRAKWTGNERMLCDDSHLFLRLSKFIWSQVVDKINLFIAWFAKNHFQM